MAQLFDFDLVETADGSYTLFVPELNEHYHSTNGAVQEALHVFIQSALYAHTAKQLNVLEVGFGTGLNALLTYASANQRQVRVAYHSVEYNPIMPMVAMMFNYHKFVDFDAFPVFQKMHNLSWDAEHRMTEFFSLLKMQFDLTKDRFEVEKFYDVIYFDAFGPDKQPEMWSEEIFQKLFAISKPGAILTTYSAKGDVRRSLAKVGFTVEKIQGPLGKREMLRATKPII